MNHGQILKRAWRILWSYRVLWIFGIILALVSPNARLSDQINWQTNQDEISKWNLPADVQNAFDQLNDLFPKEMSPETFRTVITVAIIVGVVILVLGVFFAILGYVSETALIRMVDLYEASGEKVTFLEGFRLGWSRSAWRLFLVKLVVYLPVAVIFFGLFACAATPVLLSALARDVPTIPGIIATIGLAFLVIFLAIIVRVVLSLVMETVFRTVVLEESEVIAGLRRGWGLVRNNFKDVGLMWLILIGIQIGFAIALIPVAFLMLFLGLIVGGGAGVGVYFLVLSFAEKVTSLIIALTVGAGLFFLVLGVPLAFIGGLFKTYLSSVWTLTYRALVQPSLPDSLDVEEDQEVDETENTADNPADSPADEPS